MTPPLPSSPPHLQNPRTWKLNFLRHPVGSQHKAIWEVFLQILLDWPLGHKPLFFPMPIFMTHVGVSLEGPSRSEPVKTHCHVWLTVPTAALIPFFLPPAPSFWVVCQKSGWSANPPGTGAHVSSRNHWVIVCTALLFDWTYSTIETELMGMHIADGAIIIPFCNYTTSVDSYRMDSMRQMMALA